jgi:hypothetical protein
MPFFSVQGWREKEVPVNRLPLLIVLGWLIVLRPLAIDLFIVAIFYCFSFSPSIHRVHSSWPNGYS